METYNSFRFGELNSFIPNHSWVSIDTKRHIKKYPPGSHDDMIVSVNSELISLKFCKSHFLLLVVDEDDNDKFRLKMVKVTVGLGH